MKRVKTTLNTYFPQINLRVIYSPLFILLLFFHFTINAQNNPDNFIGTHYEFNASNQMKVFTLPRPNNTAHQKPVINLHSHTIDSNSSHIRYSYGEQYGEGYSCSESGNGLYSAVGWSFSGQRISLFGNQNNYTIWDFPTPGTIMNYTSFSASGLYVAASAGTKIYLLDRITGSPVQTFNLTSLSDTGLAGSVVVTSNADFFVGSAVRNDSSTVLGFHFESNSYAWKLRIPGELFGMKKSGNDSLIIINTYNKFWVVKTYSGSVVYQGLINPYSNDGTQFNQGISGNGNIIATINYDGYLRVYQWSGTTYSLLWEHQESPGQFYNWMSAVDISNDGNMISCGTLDFITDTVYDGRIKLFNTLMGSTPLWTYEGCGDEVSSVAFSKNGRIFSAASWGNLRNPSVNNLLIFKTSNLNNTPLYAINGAGSFFCCSISDDGQTVIGSGREVHARSYGNGGTFYNLFIDTSATPIGIKNIHDNVPVRFKLYQNYPNPFNPSTRIKFDIPDFQSPLYGSPFWSRGEGRVITLKVYDILGKEIATLFSSPLGKIGGATYEVTWTPTDLPSAVFFYKIIIIDASNLLPIYSESKKMLLLK